jgi:RNA polymerase sigma-70 factor (ECF subfamily)
MTESPIHCDAMSSAYERGRAAWRDVPLAREAFAAHVAALDVDDTNAADLYLACACAAGVPEAIGAFERYVIAEVPKFIARVDPSPQTATELQQHLREYLLVAPPGTRPRIADYSGRGALGGWVRVVAVRRLRRMRHKEVERPASDAQLVERMATVQPDPGRALAQARHVGEVAQALQAAIAALAPRDRALLKMHVLDGLTIDELGAVHNVHRATAARWIAKLKQQILDEATGRIRDRLALDTDEARSLCEAVRSQVELSLGGLADERE